jgi:tetratricopeptide (TPR) repeat protein
MLGRRALGFLIFLAACVPSGFGQSHNSSPDIFTIIGSVRDSRDLHALENVRVELKGSEGIPLGSTLTRANGEFQFSDLARGEYILSVKARDYGPLQQTVEVMNSTRQSVSLLLTRPGQGAASSANATISAHQLSAPYKAQSAFDKGVVLLYDKLEYRESIAEFQRAIKDFPTYFEAYAQEGIAYLSLGETPAAESALRNSVDLSHGKYPEALILLSGILNDSRRYEEAEKLSQQALQETAPSWRAQFELARAQYGLKQMDGAEKNAVQARDLNPEDPAVYILLANIHIGKHFYPVAVNDLAEFLKLAPAAPEADAARAKQEQLQTILKREEDQARVAALRKRNPAADAPDDADENAGGADTDSAPDSLGADSPNLPSLPPPAANGQ